MYELAITSDGEMYFSNGSNQERWVLKKAFTSGTTPDLSHCVAKSKKGNAIKIFTI